MSSRVFLSVPCGRTCYRQQLQHLAPMPVRDTFPIKLSEFNPEMDDLIDSSPSGLGCVRAVRAAIVIEAASALLIYGIWALAHMHR